MNNPEQSCHKATVSPTRSLPTTWRVTCPSCGRLGNYDSKAGATRVALAHERDAS